MKLKHGTVSILISVWTIVQTLVHLVWNGYAFALCLCHVPSNYVFAFIYMTYFYEKKCGEVVIDEIDSFDLFGFLDDFEMKNVVREVAKRAVFPQNSHRYIRTYFYVYSSMIVEVLWAVSAVLLIIGVCLKTKGKLSYFFYWPWLTTAGFIIFVDVVYGLLYGLDIVHITDLKHLLSYIGVENWEEFSALSSGTSTTIPKIPAIILMLLASRFFIPWILNVMSFYTILQASLLARTDKTQKSFIIQNSLNESTASAQDRIRNWQLHYGTLETSQDSDHNSNSLNNSRRVNIINNINEESRRESGGYCSFQNVDGCLRESQLAKPWSYTERSKPKFLLKEDTYSSTQF